MMKYFLITTLVVLVAGCKTQTAEEFRERNHLPGPDFVADATQGRTLYSTNCSSCHGTTGSGTKNGPPLIHKIYDSSHHADIAFHWAVRDGVKPHHWNFGEMPKIPNLSPDATGHIIAYVRNEQKRQLNQ